MLSKLLLTVHSLHGKCVGILQKFFVRPGIPFLGEGLLLRSFFFFSSVVNIEEQQTTFSLNLKKIAHTVCTPYVAKFTVEMLQYANNTMLRAQSARKIFV